MWGCGVTTPTKVPVGDAAKRAVPEALETVRKQPANAKAHAHLGALYLSSGDNQKAFNALARAKSLAASDRAILQQYGVACIKTGRLEEAHTHFLRLLSMDPSWRSVYEARIFPQFLDALVERLRHRADRAHALLADAIDEGAANTTPQKSAGVFKLAGDFWYRTGSYRTALGLYNRALNRSSDSPDLMFKKGQCLAALGETKDALESFDAYLAKQSTPALKKQAMLVIATHLELSFRFAAATIFFKRLIVDDPNSEEMRWSLARVHLKQNQVAEARQIVEGQLLGDKPTTEKLLRAAKFFQRFNQRAEAIKLWQRAVHQAPSDIGLWKALATSLRKTGRLNEVEDLIGHANRHRMWAELYVHLGDFPRAEKRYRKAIRANSDSYLYLALANVLHRRGRIRARDKAMRMYGKKAKGSDDALVKIAESYEQFGDIKSSIATWQKRLEQSPDDEKAVFALARLFQDLGDEKSVHSVVQAWAQRDQSASGRAGRWSRVARSHQRGRRYRLARKAWEAVVQEKKTPHLRAALLHLGDLNRLRLAAPEQAITAYRAWLKAAPASEGRAGRSEILKRLGKRKQYASFRHELLQQMVGDTPEEAHGYRLLAESYLRQRPPRLAEALRTWERYIKLSPSRNDAIIVAGKALEKARDQAGAAALFRQLDIDDIDDPTLHATLGQLFSQQQELTRAERHFQRYVVLRPTVAPKNRGVERKMARTAQRRGLYAVAVTLYERLLPTATDKANVLFAIAESQLALGDESAASARFAEYLSMKPGNIRALRNVASAFYRKRFLRSAALYYEKIFERKGQKRAFPWLVDIYTKLGDFDALRSVARRYVESSSNEFAASRDAARYLKVAGLPADALPYLQRAVALRPRLTPLWEQLLELMLRLKRVDEADEAIRGRILRRASATDMWLKGAQLMARFGYDERALGMLDEAHAQGKNNGETHVLRAEILLRQGETERANEGFLDALNHADNTDALLKRIAALHVESGQLGRLRVLLMRARTLFPSRTVTLFELGRTNLALGLEVEAGESFQQYAEQVSDGALDVGQEYEVAGNEKMAVLYYEQALAQAVTKRRPESLERLIRALISSGKSHRIADAIQKYLLVERKESDRTRSLADLLVRTGRHREAIGLMEEAQHRSPTPLGWRQLGRMCLLVGDLDRAQAAFDRHVGDWSSPPRRRPSKRLVSSSPVDRELQVATDYEEIGLEDIALERVTLASHRYPEYASLQVRLARMQWQRDELTAAMSALEMLPRMTKFSSLSGNDLNILQKLSVQSHRSSDVLTILREIPDNHWSIRLSLALVTLGLHTSDAAVVEKAAKRLSSTTVPIASRLGLGLAHYQAGRLEKAAQFMRSVLVPNAGPQVVQPAAQTLLKIRRLQRVPDPVAEVSQLVARVLEGRSEYASAMTMALMHAGYLEAAADFGQMWIASSSHREMKKSSTGTDMEKWHALIHIQLLLGREAAAGNTIEQSIDESLSPRSRRIATARWLKMRREYRLAYRYYLQVVSQNVSHGPMRLEAAEVALELGKNDDATTHFERYLALTDRPSEAHRRIGDLWFRFGEFHRAENHYRHVKQGMRGHDFARFLRLVRSGEHPRAKALVQAHSTTASQPSVTVLRYAALYLTDDSYPAQLALDFLADPRLESGRKHPVYALVRAAALAETGENTTAKKQLKQVLSGGGAQVAALYNPKEGKSEREAVSQAYRVFIAKALQGRRLPLALWAMEDSRRVDSSVRVGEGLVHELQNTLETGSSDWTDEQRMQIRSVGLQTLEWLMARTEKPGWAVTAKASFYEHTNDISGAIQVYKEAISHEPNDATLYNNLAYLMASHSLQLDEALSLVRKASALEPGDRFYFHDTEAWILHRMGRSKEALKLLQSAIRYGYTSSEKTMSETYFHLGSIHRSLGNHTKAKRAFSRAWRVDPTGEYGKKSKPLR